MTLRWVVQNGDPSTVEGVVLRAGGDLRAVREGRVFVGRRRALRADETVACGDEVIIAPASSLAEEAPAVTLLIEESDFVAVDKPAGVPTIADHGGAAHALVARAASLLRVDPSRLHPTSRLDREVSGVVVFALDPQAAARFAKARELHRYQRRYVAVATTAVGRLEPSSSDFGTWDAPIGRARDPRHRAANGKDAARARTHFATVAAVPRYALLALAPITGRTHQLRVHAAHAGAPLLGDRIYGGSARVTLATGRVLALDRIALHAAQVTVPRADGEPLAIVAPVPEALRALWLSLGGADAAWDSAVARALPTS